MINMHTFVTFHNEEKLLFSTPFKKIKKNVIKKTNFENLQINLTISINLVSGDVHHHHHQISS